MVCIPCVRFCTLSDACAHAAVARALYGLRHVHVVSGWPRSSVHGQREYRTLDVRGMLHHPCSACGCVRSASTCEHCEGGGARQRNYRMPMQQPDSATSSCLGAGMLTTVKWGAGSEHDAHRDGGNVRSTGSDSAPLALLSSGRARVACAHQARCKPLGLKSPGLDSLSEWAAGGRCQWTAAPAVTVLVRRGRRRPSPALRVP